MTLPKYLGSSNSIWLRAPFQGCAGTDETGRGGEGVGPRRGSQPPMNFSAPLRGTSEPQTPQRPSKTAAHGDSTPRVPPGHLRLKNLKSASPKTPLHPQYALRYRARRAGAAAKKKILRAKKMRTAHTAAAPDVLRYSLVVGGTIIMRARSVHHIWVVRRMRRTARQQRLAHA